MRKGPTVADSVTIRSPFGEERCVSKNAVPYFTNQGFVALDSAGRTKAQQQHPAPAASEKKEH
jgi:hypothetical protein